jgi:hypothetical protein
MPTHEEIMKKQRIERQASEVAEKAYGSNLDRARNKMEYVKNLVNGRYFLERYNTIAEQIIQAEQTHSDKILELLDGVPKNIRYASAEAALFKMQAIVSMRNAHFAKDNLMNVFKMTSDEVTLLEKDYYDGKIVREDYDDEFKKRNKAEFVAEHTAEQNTAPS